MIEIKKKIFINSHLLTEIHSCDCFFERITSLINSNSSFDDNRFIEKLENEFDVDRYLILIFGGSIVAVCKKMLNFLQKIIKERIFMEKCVLDFIKINDEIVRICTVCLLKVLRKTKILLHFLTSQEIYDETYYIYM